MYKRFRKKIVKKNVYPVSKIRFLKMKKNKEIILFENITGRKYFELTGSTVNLWEDQYLFGEI